MYNFEPSEEQTMLIDWAKRYATNALRPASHEAEETATLPKDVIDQGWEMGILQASIPEAYGGFGDHSAVTGVLAAEELAWGDLAGAMAVMTPGLFAYPILLAGSEAQKEAYLAPLVEDEWKPYTAALVEATFNFDPNELKTTATLDGDVYVINGEKTFVPYGDGAEAFIVYANLDGKTQGFIVPGELTGVEAGDRCKLLGVNGVPTYNVKFNEVRIPQGNRLGGEDGHEMDKILASMQLGIASLGVGLAKGAFEYARDYAKDRDAFGVKIAQKQAIAFMLAEMAIEVEAIRLLIWEAAWKVDNDHEDAAKHAYLAHIGAVDMAMVVTDRAVQVLGGHGYIREHPVEHWMRNGRGIASLLGLAMI
jgi:alkylation response protein AidB-like acyl-CoA dehydrogenase